MTNLTRRDFTRAAALTTALSYSRISRRQRPRPHGLHRPGQPRRPGARRFPRARRSADRGGLRPARRLHGFRDQEIARHSEEVQRLPEAAGRQGRGRRGDRHARSLARADVHRRLPRRQGRLRGEAAVADRGGRPQDGGGRRAHQARVAGGHPPALDGRLCKEAAEFVRSGGIGQVTVARAYHITNEWPNGIGNPAGQRAARAPRNGTSGSARRPRCPTTRTACFTTSAGSTTIPAAS